MGGALRRRNNTNYLEMSALFAARSAARAWLRRNLLRPHLLVIHSDNQGIAELMASREVNGGAYRWLAREHPLMRLAHRVARTRACGCAKPP